jgi:hypothetical protein
VIAVKASAAVSVTAAASSNCVPTWKHQTRIGYGTTIIASKNRRLIRPKI